MEEWRYVCLQPYERIPSRNVRWMGGERIHISKYHTQLAKPSLNQNTSFLVDLTAEVLFYSYLRVVQRMKGYTRGTDKIR